MSSESGTGTLSSSALRLGAPAKGTTADLLDGDTLTSSAAPLARWPPLSLSLGFVEETWKGRKWLGFSVERPRPLILSERLTCLGSFRPRWAERKSAQAFVVFYQSACGLGRTGISRQANFGLRILKCFSFFFRNKNKPV
jgi:hypothetical protein